MTLHHLFYFPVKKITVRLFVLLFFCHSVLYAQTARYVLTQYNSENGLPQNTVKAIKFDRNGFCWLATETGIVRFDNRNFKTYGSDIIKALKGERISAMITDTAGNILVQNISQQNFKIPASSSLFTIIPTLTHNNFSFVKTGYIIKSPTMDSLWEAIYTQKSIPILKEPGGLKNGHIYLFFGDEAYFIYNNRIVPLKPNDADPTGSLIVNDTYYLQLWRNNKSRIWHNGTELSIPITGDIVANKAYMEGNFNTLWCEEGAYVYAGGSLYELFYHNGQLQSNTVASNLTIENPLCIAYRPDIKTYFIGTGTQGFFTIKLSDFAYPDIPKQSGPENYYTITKTSKDEVIVHNAVIKPDNSALYAALNNHDSRASYTDTADRVYYENSFYLSRYNTRTGKVDKTLTQLDNRLLEIVPDEQDNTLLLCTHTSLYKVTREGIIIWQKKFPENMKATGFSPVNRDMYLLSTSAGLKWYNMRQHVITQTILDSFQVRTVYRDHLHRLWIGTDGKGSYLYANNTLYNLPAGPRGAFKSIHSFIKDGSDHFWLPTNNGLYKVAITTLADFVTGKSDNISWLTFNQTNGLRTNEFNGGANPNFQWLQDGALVLPSINGLVKFYPDRIQSDFPKERILIDDINIDGENITPGNINEIIYLQPNFQTLNIKVTCPYFGNNDNLQLQYKIGSSDGQWVPVPASGIISINQLPANNYTLIIRKAGSSPTTPNGSINLKVVVQPFFYQTLWFFLGIILLIVGFGYWYSRRRLHKLEKEKVKIEKIVELRTTELSTAVQQLEYSQTALQKSNEVKEQIITTVLHDLRSPLYSMRVTGKALLKNWEQNPEENLNQVKGLHHLIGELSRFTDQFFSWAISQQEHFTVKKVHFPLQQVFTDLEALFKEILQVNNNVFQVKNTNIQCFTDRDMLILILRNLVDNANKNTENGTVSMTAVSLPNGFAIRVADTGKGLNAFQIDNFLNKDIAVKNGRMGSVIILEMLQNINGELLIQSEPGKGTVFTIQVYSAE